VGIFLTRSQFKEQAAGGIAWAGTLGVGLSHDSLVLRAERWLINSKGCVLTLVERCAGGSGETPDAIGWQPGTLSILVECKTSLSDFYSDRQKPWRRLPEQGVGAYRYFLTPPGLIDPSRHSMPEKWGLLECGANQIRQIIAAQMFAQRNLKREMKLLIQPCRWNAPLPTAGSTTENSNSSV
jgi:hypothetical protein